MTQLGQQNSIFEKKTFFFGGNNSLKLNLYMKAPKIFQGLSLGVTFICLLLSSCAQTEPVSDANIPKLSPQKQIMDAYASGQRKIRIKPGVYRLESQKGSEFHLSFERLKDCEIDASGATFIFETRDCRGLLFRDCHNVRFHGATMLRETPPFSQGDIVAIAEDRNSVDIEVHRGYPCDLDNERYFYRTPVLTVYDPNTTKLKGNVPDLYLKKIERLGDRLFRFYMTEKINPNIPVSSGDMAAWRGGSPNGFAGHEVDIVICSGMRFEDVVIKNARGLSVAEYGGDGGSYYSYKLTYGNPPKDATQKPLLAGSADGFFSALVRKGPTVENCLWEGTHDDTVNIHSGLCKIMESDGASAVIEYNEMPETAGKPGDRIQFIDGKCRVVAEAGALAFERLKEYRTGTKSESSYFRIKFAKEVQIGKDWKIINNDTAGNGFTVRNCISRDHRAHGFFIRAGEGIIENCLLENIHMGGIVVAPEFGSWGEGPYSRNLIIRNNIIRHVGIATQPWNSGLTIAAWEGIFVPLPGGHRNILVENNVFENNDGPNMMISSAIGVNVKNNIFINPMRKTAYHCEDFGADYNALIWATETENLSFEGNVVRNPGQCMKSLLKVTSTASGTGFDDGIKVE